MKVFTRASNELWDITGIPDLQTGMTLHTVISVTATPGGSDFPAYITKGSSSVNRNFWFDYRLRTGVANLELNWTTAPSTFVEYFKAITLVFNQRYDIIWTVDWSTNPDQVELYIDGVAQTPTLSGSNNGTPNVPATQVAKMGGQIGSATDTWSGEQCETAIWSAVLTAGEINSLVKGFSPRLIRPQSLVFYPRGIRDIMDIKGCVITPTGTTTSAHPRVIG